MSDRPRIHRVLTRLREASGLPLTFGGAVHEGWQVRLTEFAGRNRGALRGVALGAGLGLGGKVVAVRRPLSINDYVASPGISHDYDRIIAAEGLRAMVAAPVVVRGKARAVLYGSTRSAEALGDRVLQMFQDAARELEQSLAVAAEVERRLAWLREHGRAGASDGAGPDGPRREQVREAYAELRILSQQTGDPRLAAVCAKLAGTGDAPKLSERELDVLSCVALGWTNTHIATDLGVGAETVKSYLRGAMRKLGAHTRMEAVVTARRRGLLP